MPFRRHAPQTTLRRALFVVHMWLGIGAGAYVLLVATTGAALVFRIDLQRALHPHLFTASTGPLSDPATILERVRDAYPAWRVSGIDAPTTARPTYLAYVTRGSEFLTLLLDPAGGKVLGELPAHTLVRMLQDLHFNLLAGRTGRVVNGIGAGLLLALAVSGLAIWWPASRRRTSADVGGWWSMPGAHAGASARATRTVHRTVGCCAAAFLIMWAVTGFYFAFPSQVRAVVNSVSPLTARAAPASAPQPAGMPAPGWRELIARARMHRPGEHVARVVLPGNERGAFLVLFAPTMPYSPGGTALTPVYLDQHTGERLVPPNGGRGSAGDRVIDWIPPLHVGNFAGTGVKVAWFLFGLSPAMLFVTGLIMWWIRVVAPRRRSAQATAGTPTSGRR